MPLLNKIDTLTVYNDMVKIMKKYLKQNIHFGMCD